MSSNYVLDNWQQKIYDYNGNITIRSGRQVGKSFIISLKVVKFALENPGTTTLIIAASQRQSSLLFEKVKFEIQERNVKLAEEPTLTRVVLDNGSRIYSLPAGRSGYFIRGFSLDLVVADEAAYISEVCWNAIVPMIAVSRKARGLGFIILLSTPFGKGGYFYNSFFDPEFLQVHVSSENCERIPKDFLKKERVRMSKQEYAQEYLGEFIDDFRQFFPTQLIKSCMTFLTWEFEKDFKRNAKYYLGVDVARFGGDQNAFVVGELLDNKLKIVKVHTTERKSLTDSCGEIRLLDDFFHFKRIFIDDAGVGGGLVDMLQEKFGKRRVIGLNNASKSIFYKEEKRRVILKEDLYSNALIMMESKSVELIDDLDFLRSLKSIVFEYTSDKNLKLFGDYSHLTEAFVRCCWCVQDKGFTPMIV